MAESQSMTTAEVVAKILLEEHADFLREAVAMLVAAQIMEAEISSEIGAGKGEVSAVRATHRNGYRQRLWETSALHHALRRPHGGGDVDRERRKGLRIRVSADEGLFDAAAMNAEAV
jgi:transposase-like protein